MGWFWSSPSSSAASSGDKPTETSTLPATTTQPATSPAQQRTPPTPSPSPAGASSGDAEIQKFLEMLQGDDATKKSSQPQQPTPSPTSSEPAAAAASPSVLAKYKAYIPFSSLLIKDDPAAPEPEAAPKKTLRSPISLAMSEHTLPSTLSCRDAFDYAWHCQTPGAQFNAVYRYGTMKNCSELWDDFWFCMRTKSFSPEMKAEAVKEYYRKKEEAKYGGGRPSSEDVWESRERRVEWDSEFRQSWEGPGQVSDEEFKRMEVERRRQIREQLGLDEK